MKRKITLSYLLYFIIISSYLLYTIGNYDHFSPYLIFYIFSYYIIGYYIIVEIFRKGILSLSVLFNVFGILYINFYIIDSVSKNISIKENYLFAMFISYCAILIFNISYNLTNEKSHFLYSQNKYSINVKRFNLGLILLFLLSVLAFYYVVFIKIGFTSYIISSRAEKSLMRSDYSLMLFYPYTLPLVSSLSLYLFLFYRKKINLLIFIISFVTSVFDAITSASRGSLLCVLMPTVFLLNHFKVISNKFTILLGGLGFLLFGVWKSLYYDEIEIQYDSEFVSWYRICDRILSDPKGIPWFYGKTYFETILNFLIPVTNTEALSTWYVKNYETDVFASGGGRGFPSVLEAFLNFHVFGVLLIYGFYGVLLKKVTTKCSLGVFLYMIILVSLYKLFRAPAYSIWKNMMWFQIYPTVFIWWYSRVKVTKSCISK